MILVGKQFLSKPKFYQAPFSLLLPELQLIALLNIVNIIKHARNHDSSCIDDVSSCNSPSTVVLGIRPNQSSPKAVTVKYPLSAN